MGAKISKMHQNSAVQHPKSHRLAKLGRWWTSVGVLSSGKIAAGGKVHGQRNAAARLADELALVLLIPSLAGVGATNSDGE